MQASAPESTDMEMYQVVERDLLIMTIMKQDWCRMPPRLVTRWQAVTDGLEMCEMCNSRSQMEGRWNAMTSQ